MTRMKSWFVRINRIGACLGVGALFVPVALADTTPAAVAAAHAEAGGVLIRIEGDAIFISERGRPFERLDLKDGAEADHIRGLLREAAGARQVPADIGRATVADGAAGWHHP